MKRATLLMIICLSCCAFAQSDAPDEYYSHLSVVVGGEPCTVISQAIVQDSGGAEWNLPNKVVLPKRPGEPCPTRPVYTKNPIHANSYCDFCSTWCNSVETGTDDDGSRRDGRME